MVRWQPEPARSEAAFSFRARDPAGAQEMVFASGLLLIPDGELLRRFDVSKPRVSPLAEWQAPEPIFGRQVRLRTLAWGPDGFLYFGLARTDGSGAGIGRVTAAGQQCELFSTGVGGENGLTLDRHGNLLAAGKSGVFHVPAGVRFFEPRWNLEGYELARCPALLPAGEAESLVYYDGDALPEENRGTLLAVHPARETLNQYRLSEQGASLRAEFWREIGRLQAPAMVRSMQVGPDGAVWLRVEESGRGSLLRLGPGLPRRPAVNLERMSTLELAEQLAHTNSWQRRTASRLLASRTDLPEARGLHPTTRLHVLLRKAPDPQTRLEALWALHGMRLLEDDHLEETAVDPDPWVRAWSARLVGERRWPTRVAFKALEKLADSTNALVRSAVAVAARQFVSGSLTQESPPVLPLREVFTGGVLSGLWFASLKENDAVISQQFWNAVKPISGFDPVHPLGFFKGKQNPPTPFQVFVLRNLTAQLAETSDPAQFAAGVAAVGALDPQSGGIARAALLGLLDGTARLQVRPRPQERRVIEEFRAAQDPAVRKAAESLLKRWTDLKSGPLPGSER